MPTLLEKIQSTSKRVPSFIKNHSDRYKCGICGTTVEIKAVPKESTFFYNIYCPNCAIVLTGTHAGYKDTLFVNAIKQGYIKPIDK